MYKMVFKFFICCTLITSCTNQDSEPEKEEITIKASPVEKPVKDTIFWDTPMLEGIIVLNKYDADSLLKLKFHPANIPTQLFELPRNFQSKILNDSIKIPKQITVTGNQKIITTPRSIYQLKHKSDTIVVLTYLQKNLFQGNYPQFYASVFLLKNKNLLFLKNFHTISQEINFIGYNGNRSDLLFLAYNYTRPKKFIDVYSYDSNFQYRNDIKIPVLAADIGFIVIEKEN